MNKRVILWPIALMLGSSCEGGELLPTQGQESAHMQQALDDTLRPAVLALRPDIRVQPIILSIDIAGPGKRLFWGPLAGGSHVTLRVVVFDRDRVFEKTISERAGAWHGTFRPGQDYNLVKLVAKEAAEFVQHYEGAENEGESI